MRRGEVICILSHATPRGVQRLAEELRVAMEALSGPSTEIGRSVTVNIGVSVAPTDRQLENLAGLVRAAKAALFRVKGSGQNRIAAACETSSGTALAKAATEAICA
ncbi:MAG: diguanylate cyclase [Methylobacterium sp.]|uniref:GGDEF domain-containing protein n=1 Tax=Methylobacterium sp. TaxID=409 RepID=UPI0025FFDE76|nr:diguanylate cyclase [Methylobacterium sp.]MBX9933138.1 diguanylate cyclase [Methylobacterium sp.]